MDVKISHRTVTQIRTEPSVPLRIDSKQINSPSIDRPQRKIPYRRQRGKLSGFFQAQRKNLLELRASLVDSLSGIAREARQDKSDSSALSTHSADAGSDACDRDFVLSLLSQGTDALLEIDEALTRIDAGTYGTCEMSGRPIPLPRLRTIPFARFTVECQAKIENQRRLHRTPTFPSPFSLADEEESDEDAEASG